MEAELRAALEWITAHAHDQDAVIARSMCADRWHRHRRSGGGRCPVCASSWWDVDGKPPHPDHAAAYALDAVAAQALAAQRPVRERELEAWRFRVLDKDGDEADDCFPAPGRLPKGELAWWDERRPMGAPHRGQESACGPWQDVTDEGGGA